jgi:IclR family transcriptional regulator, KDG regulon repressor
MQSTDESAGETELDSHAATRRAKPLAPAVARAVRIIGYLGETEQGASVSDIARALSINKSTCFNILSTLVDNQVVSKHPRFHIYRLGPRLVEWGRASRTQFAGRTGLRDAIGEFVADVGAACLVGQTLADNRGVVVFDRMVPNRPGVLTPQIGEVFPLSDPAMGRLVLSSFEDEEDALRVARQVGLIGPDGDAAEFTNDLARIRQQGYSASKEDETNAVATSLSPSASEIVTLLCVIGHRRDLPDEEVDSVGVRLIEFGQRLLSRPATSEAFMAWSVRDSSG